MEFYWYNCHLSFQTVKKSLYSKKFPAGLRVVGMSETLGNTTLINIFIVWDRVIVISISAFISVLYICYILWDWINKNTDILIFTSFSKVFANFFTRQPIMKININNYLKMRCRINYLTLMPISWSLYSYNKFYHVNLTSIINCYNYQLIAWGIKGNQIMIASRRDVSYFFSWLGEFYYYSGTTTGNIRI